MAFTSLSFLALVTAVVLLTNAFPAPRTRAWVLLAGSAVFLASHVDSALQLAPLAGFLLLAYGAIELVRRTRSSLLLGVALLSLVATFLMLKRYDFAKSLVALPFPYLLVGLSYVLFRVLHLLVDAQQGELGARLPVSGFVGYCLNFLSFTAGPIQRYSEFAAAQAGEHSLDQAKVEALSSRVVRGFVKIAVASAVFSYLFENASARLLNTPAVTSVPALALLYASTATAYAAHLYFNFAGYMDVVIGIGGLIGLPLPENFERPFAARNFLDFWSRWHITLSTWFKTYLFNPLLKALATRFGSAAAAPYLAVVAFFVTFTVMGVWHGSSAVFLVYGLLLGAGASINKAWQVLANKHFGKQAYKRACERTAVIYLSRGLTFSYFVLALTCLWLELAQLSALARQLGLFGVIAAYFGLAWGSAVAFFCWDALATALARPRAFFARAHEWGALCDAVRAAQVLLIVGVGSFFHQTPEFVYRAF